MQGISLSMQLILLIFKLLIQVYDTQISKFQMNIPLDVHKQLC